MAKEKRKTTYKPKKKTPIQKLRYHVSHEAGRMNELLQEVRKNNPAWLYQRWGSYLYEHGTKREGLFRRTTSSMNTAQLKEYRALLLSFKEDMEYEEHMQKQYSEHFLESDYDFLKRIEEEAYSLYFKYFPPSEREARAFQETVKSSIQSRLNDREYMIGKDHADLYKNLLDKMRIAGNVQDPMQGDTTKFRDIFTVDEVTYNGQTETRRYLY